MIFIFKYVIGVILGEEDLKFPLNPKIISKGCSNFFKTGYGSGYKVNIDGLSINIHCSNKLALVFGLTPLYYFEGVLQQENKETLAAGRIMMGLPARYFFLVWFCLVFLGLIIFVMNTLYLLIKFIFSSSPELQYSLLNAGIMLGGSALVLAFGFMLLNFIKFISRSQKNSLREFCKSLQKESQMPS